MGRVSDCCGAEVYLKECDADGCSCGVSLLMCSACGYGCL